MPNHELIGDISNVYKEELDNKSMVYPSFADYQKDFENLSCGNVSFYKICEQVMQKNATEPQIVGDCFAYLLALRFLVKEDGTSMEQFFEDRRRRFFMPEIEHMKQDILESGILNGVQGKDPTALQQMLSSPKEVEAAYQAFDQFFAKKIEAENMKTLEDLKTAEPLPQATADAFRNVQGLFDKHRVFPALGSGSEAWSQLKLAGDACSFLEGGTGRVPSDHHTLYQAQKALWDLGDTLCRQTRLDTAMKAVPGFGERPMALGVLRENSFGSMEAAERDLIHIGDYLGSDMKKALEQAHQEEEKLREARRRENEEAAKMLRGLGMPTAADFKAKGQKELEKIGNAFNDLEHLLRSADDRGEARQIKKAAYRMQYLGGGLTSGAIDDVALLRYRQQMEPLKRVLTEEVETFEFDRKKYGLPEIMPRIDYWIKTKPIDELSAIMDVADGIMKLDCGDLCQKVNAAKPQQKANAQRIAEEERRREEDKVKDQMRGAAEEARKRREALQAAALERQKEEMPYTLQIQKRGLRTADELRYDRGVFAAANGRFELDGVAHQVTPEQKKAEEQRFSRFVRCQKHMEALADIFGQASNDEDETYPFDRKAADARKIREEMDPIRSPKSDQALFTSYKKIQGKLSGVVGSAVKTPSHYRKELGDETTVDKLLQAYYQHDGEQITAEMIADDLIGFEDVTGLRTNAKFVEARRPKAFLIADAERLEQLKAKEAEFDQKIKTAEEEREQWRKQAKEEKRRQAEDEARKQQELEKRSTMEIQGHGLKTAQDLRGLRQDPHIADLLRHLQTLDQLFGQPNGAAKQLGSALGVVQAPASDTALLGAYGTLQTQLGTFVDAPVQTPQRYTKALGGQTTLEQLLQAHYEQNGGQYKEDTLADDLIALEKKTGLQTNAKLIADRKEKLRVQEETARFEEKQEAQRKERLQRQDDEMSAVMIEQGKETDTSIYQTEHRALTLLSMKSMVDYLENQPNDPSLAGIKDLMDEIASHCDADRKAPSKKAIKADRSEGHLQGRLAYWDRVHLYSNEERVTKLLELREEAKRLAPEKKAASYILKEVNDLLTDPETLKILTALETKADYEAGLHENALEKEEEKQKHAPTPGKDEQKHIQANGEDEQKDIQANVEGFRKALSQTAWDLENDFAMADLHYDGTETGFASVKEKAATAVSKILAARMYEKAASGIKGLEQMPSMGSINETIDKEAAKIRKRDDLTRMMADVIDYKDIVALKEKAVLGNALISELAKYTKISAVMAARKEREELKKGNKAEQEQKPLDPDRRK